MKKSIMHRNPIGHWECVATTTLRWKVILKLFISTFAFAKNAHAYDDLRNSFLPFLYFCLILIICNHSV